MTRSKPEALYTLYRHSEPGETMNQTTLEPETSSPLPSSRNTRPHGPDTLKPDFHINIAHQVNPNPAFLLPAYSNPHRNLLAPHPVYSNLIQKPYRAPCEPWAAAWLQVAQPAPHTRERQGSGMGASACREFGGFWRTTLGAKK